MLTDPQILKRNGLKHLYDPGAGAALFGLAGVAEEQIISPLYKISLPMWTSLTSSSDRGVVVIRDLRDQIVSQVFSVAYSHASSRRIEFNRSFLLALPRSQWIEFGMLLAEIEARAIESWFEGSVENVLVVRYEELVAETESTLTRMFAFLGIEASTEDVQRIVEVNSFSKLTGRKPGEENVLSHLRKGCPGDWRNHFTRKQAELFEQTWPKLLSRTGYAVDDQWPKEIDARKSSQDGEDATSIVSTLLKQRRELETRSNELAATCEAKEAVIRELAAASEARLGEMKRLAAELERLKGQSLLRRLMNSR